MPTSLLELLRLPDVPVVQFENPPLVLTICQVKYNPVLGVANPSVVAPFQRAIEQSFPIVEGPLSESGLEVAISAGGAQVQQRQIPSTRYQFTTEDGTWTAVLTHDFVALETRAYENFDDFLQRFQRLLSALIEHIQPTFITRLGLRYINEIRLESLPYDEVIRRELLGPLAVPELGTAVHQAIQQLLLRYQGNYGLNLRHGLLPEGSTILPRPGETPSKCPFYLLDFDAYCEKEPGSSALPTDPTVLCSYVEAYNKAIYRVFRWAVTDRYVSTLGLR